MGEGRGRRSVGGRWGRRAGSYEAERAAALFPPVRRRRGLLLLVLLLLLRRLLSAAPGPGLSPGPRGVGRGPAALLGLHAALEELEEAAIVCKNINTTAAAALPAGAPRHRLPPLPLGGHFVTGAPRAAGGDGKSQCRPRGTPGKQAKPQAREARWESRRRFLLLGIGHRKGRREGKNQEMGGRRHQLERDWQRAGQSAASQLASAASSLPTE